MTYALGAALQGAIFQVLTQATALTDLIGNAIFDHAPNGDLPETYVILGGEQVLDRSDVTARGALHRFEVLVVTGHGGFLRAKEAAATICDVLVDADLSLARGRLVSLCFDRASASRDGTRRITLRFAARLEDG